MMVDDERVACEIGICHLGPADWGAIGTGPAESTGLVAQIWQRVEAWRTGDIFAYHESVSECRLQRTTLADYRPPAADAWNGRLFAGNADVRWVCRPTDGGRAFEAWITFEGKPPRSQDGPLHWEPRSVWMRKRRYYLHGEFDQDETRQAARERESAFTDGRYPRAVFWYPVTGAREHDRAYVQVHEYLRCKPPNWSVGVEDAEAEVDAPLLVGHRFVAVEVGSDG